MKYTLRQLEVFLSIAHFENVSKAADKLAMSQSACSGALKDLESQFDIQLFDRVGKRLQINELGRRLRARAEALIAEAEELESELIKHKLSGKLKVGATLTIGNYLAVDLITKFVDQDPNADIQLDVANTSKISAEILNFDIDLGMIEGDLHHPDLDIIPWREDELCCFCAPTHKLAKHKQLTKQDLLETQWILREAGSGTRQTFDRAMHGLLPNINILLELQHTEAIKQAVESGIGISCLSKISLHKAFQRGSLVPLKTPELDLQRMFYLVIHKEKFRTTGIQRWLALCGVAS